MMSHADRVIILVDMDCFYCQVEEKLDPALEGKPIAVVQYNTWKGGGIIAVNYPAREKGVTRHMRGNDAKQICPEIVLQRVPEVRGKADLTKYRDAGKRVADVLQTFTSILERASVDEAYLDITEVVERRIKTDFDQVQLNNLQNTYIVGYDIQDFLHNVVKNGDCIESNCRLAMGGVIAEEIRAEVYKRTGYKCSAGIAHNKILAKLVCGLHKPNKQTILPQESVPELYKDLPITKIPGLGGKFGLTLSNQLNISKMGELITYSESQLLKFFDEKNAKWLYNLARGINYDPVTSRLISKSIGCCKKFPGKSALVTHESIKHWVNELTSEISERLAKDVKENNRRAKQITLHFTQTVDNKNSSNSRTLSLNSYDQPKIAQICLESLEKYCCKTDGTYDVKYLGFSVGKFEPNKKTGNISELLKNMKERKLMFIKWANIHPNPLELTLEQDNNYTREREVYENKMELHNSSTDETDKTYCEDNVSIYSADTDELNEDPKNLIYYEDIYDESVASEPIFIKPPNLVNHIEDKSVIEATNSESFCHGEKFSNGRSSSSSFFSKYFENYDTDESCSSSPVKRNFDTSKILVDESKYSNDNVQEFEVTSRTESPELEEKQFLATQICPECKKSISKLEFASHMDYHYALSIYREENNSSTPTQSNAPKKSSVKRQLGRTKHSPKRKAATIKSIDTYLKVDELNDENSELCSECNRRIKLDEINNHMDYHVAKKLHLEINAKSSNASNKNNGDKICIGAQKKEKKNDKHMGNIFSFINRGSV